MVCAGQSSDCQDNPQIVRVILGLSVNYSRIVSFNSRFVIHKVQLIKSNLCIAQPIYGFPVQSSDPRFVQGILQVVWIHTLRITCTVGQVSRESMEIGKPVGMNPSFLKTTISILHFGRHLSVCEEDRRTY